MDGSLDSHCVVAFLRTSPRTTPSLRRQNGPKIHWEKIKYCNAVCCFINCFCYCCSSLARKDGATRKDLKANVIPTVISNDGTKTLLLRPCAQEIMDHFEVETPIREGDFSTRGGSGEVLCQTEDFAFIAGKVIIPNSVTTTRINVGQPIFFFHFYHINHRFQNFRWTMKPFNFQKALGILQFFWSYF